MKNVHPFPLFFCNITPCRNTNGFWQMSVSDFGFKMVVYENCSYYFKLFERNEEIYFKTDIGCPHFYSVRCIFHKVVCARPHFCTVYCMHAPFAQLLVTPLLKDGHCLPVWFRLRVYFLFWCRFRLEFKKHFIEKLSNIYCAIVGIRFVWIFLKMSS